jgi:hypothetical protein
MTPAGLRPAEQNQGKEKSVSAATPEQIRHAAEQLGITEAEVESRLSAMFARLRVKFKEAGIPNIPESDEGMALFLQMHTTKEDWPQK